MILTGLDLVKKAYETALKAHYNQFRADGKTPYFDHPAAVVNEFERMFGGFYGTYPNSNEDYFRGAALCWIHDVGEHDAGRVYTRDELIEEGFESIIVEWTMLTKPKDETYLNYLLNIREHRLTRPLAWQCKLCDMAANEKDLDKMPANLAKRAKSMKTKWEMARWILTH